MSSLPSTGNVMVYDGECPFCSSYVALQRLRDSIGPVKLINARDGGPEVEWLKANNYDLNHGMAFIRNGEVYHGADAIHVIALMSSGSNWFNRLTSALFVSKAVSRTMYPALRFGRAMTLKVLRRSPISR